MADDKSTLLTRKLTRKSALWSERSTWDTIARDACEYIDPDLGRFTTSEQNNGKNKHTRIYDSTGTRALDILAAGMMSGLTSPARPWFRLATPDPDMMEYKPVKLWLNLVTMRMREVFARSNTYRGLHSMYKELGAISTSAILVNDDYDDIIRLHGLTWGEYALATDNRGKVSTLYREFKMTVEQMVNEFGIDNVSLAVKRLYEAHNYDAKVDVVHAIEPNDKRDAYKIDNRNMAFSSCYFEPSGDGNKFLRESGFKRFRALCPRWEVTSNDVYGKGPGRKALGDIRQLQHEQLRKAEAIDYMVNPPLQVPPDLADGVDRLPGGVTSTHAATSQGGIRSLFEVRLDLTHLREDIIDVRSRINANFYADLFLMLSMDTRSNITAEEIVKRHEEKMLMLGPVIERVHNEGIEPLIDITFERLMEARVNGMPVIPPPPPELEGIDLQVEFVSVLAQAQKMVGMSANSQLINTVAMIANAKQDLSAWDKIDTDQFTDVTADILGTDPTLVRSDDEVAQLRQTRAQREQTQQMAAMAKPLADAASAARSMSETDTSGKNGLTDMMAMLQGYGTQQ